MRICNEEAQASVVKSANQPTLRFLFMTQPCATAPQTWRRGRPRCPAVKGETGQAGVLTDTCSSSSY